MRIVLASASPRRKELLEQIGWTFECRICEKEEVIQGNTVEETVLALAEQKAEDVYAQLGPVEEELLVIGADTVVASEGRILTKPEGTQQAREMLKSLSGKIHDVFTGVTMIYQREGKKTVTSFAEKTAVEMYPILEEEIEAYLESGEPFDKAGSYAIQGLGAKFIKGIDGDYNTVVGLPVARVYQELRRMQETVGTEKIEEMMPEKETEEPAKNGIIMDVMPDVPWYDKAVFYHIYPLGLCGCPHENNGEQQHHFDKLTKWADHAGEMGCTAIYIGPLFESVGHGYETTDYKKVDCRLGDNREFAAFVKHCHSRGIRVVVDGVFNHVGRRFFAFEDVKKNREQSRYRDWFCNVNFYGNNEYNDGFSYENWGGYNLLVKLNVWNPEVKNYLFDVVRFWVEEFDIDGIRLDAADVLDMGFMSELHELAGGLKKDFWLMGEVIHGDYSRWANQDRLNSVTNYELHKGLYSGHNDHNYFEIAHTINRLGNLAAGIKLYTFVDNHDVARIHSKLTQKEHMYNVTILLYTVPGIPSVYYGSEFAIDGDKQNGSDWNLRPELNLEDYAEYCGNNPLYALMKELGRLKQTSRALTLGSYAQLVLTNRQFAYERSLDNEKIVVLLNNDDMPAVLNVPASAEVKLVAGCASGIETSGERCLVTLDANRGCVLLMK